METHCSNLRLDCPWGNVLPHAMKYIPSNRSDISTHFTVFDKEEPQIAHAMSLHGRSRADGTLNSTQSLSMYLIY